MGILFDRDRIVPHSTDTKKDLKRQNTCVRYNQKTAIK